jgi:hypothetical protein
MKQTASMAYSLTLKMEAIFTSKMSVDFQWSIGRYIPETEPFITTAVGTSDPTKKFFTRIPEDHKLQKIMNSSH